ncbi:unnamed protein product [Amoebophrya sp. A25]|nr:unnamed protein product [Amoebophrya sp. A25]|eukprot:GSA25T00026292001.1
MSPTALSQETDSTEAGSNADVSDIRSPLNSPSKPAFTVKTMDRMGDEAKTQAKADVKVVPCGKTKLMKAMWEKQRSVDDLGAPSGSSTLTSASGATSMPSSILQAKEALRPPSLEVPGKYADPSVTKYSLELLRGPDRPADVDPTMKERYLSGGDFVETFGLTALQFHNLPEWKRVAFKRQHGLF